MLRFFQKHSLQNIKLYRSIIKIANKNQIEQDVEEENIKQYNNIQDVLQEQSRKGFIQDESYRQVRENAKKVLIEQYNKYQDNLTLKLIIEYDLFEFVDAERLFNLDSSDKDQNLSISFANLSVLTDLLMKLNVKGENEQFQMILYNQIIKFAQEELKQKVLCISNENFQDILKAIYTLINVNKDFRQDIPNKIQFDFIQQKMNDYEEIEELIEMENMPQILYYVEKISQLTSYKFKIDILKYDNLFKKEYKSLNNKQLFYLSSFFLMNQKNEPNFTSRFFEQFYFQILSTTPLYYKEYLIRKLGIYDFDQPLLSLIKTALTRLYLMNVIQKEPKFRKYIQLKPQQKLELTYLMLENIQFQNSPLINTFLSESIEFLTQAYMYNILMDYGKEQEILQIHYRSVLRILSSCNEQLLEENKNYQNLLKMIFNYYSLHNNKFDHQMYFDLITLLNKLPSQQLLNKCSITQKEELNVSNKLTQQNNSPQKQILFETTKEDNQSKQTQVNNNSEKVSSSISTNQEKSNKQSPLSNLSKLNSLFKPSNKNEQKENTYLIQLMKGQHFQLFINIFKQNFEKLLSVNLKTQEIINNQEKINPTIQLFTKISFDKFTDCSFYFTQIANNLDKLNLSVKKSFIDYLNEYSDKYPNEVKQILLIIINKFINTKVLSESYDLKAKFLIIYMKFIKQLDQNEQYMGLLVNKIQDLMSFNINEINENNILTTIQLLLIAQNLSIQDKQLELVQDVFFRIISDSHQTFSIEKYQQIVTACMSLNNFEKNFDDGSDCYSQTLLEELRKFNTDNYKKFDQEFQKLIEPYISLEDSAISQYYESFKEQITDIAQKYP